MARIATILLLACSFILINPHMAQAFNSPNPIENTELVKEQLDKQVAAWNKGELEEAMSYYLNSENMLWVNRAGVQKGYAPVLEGYKKDFSDRSKMGVYAYEPLYIEELSSGVVYYVIKWSISIDGEKAMGGISSQIWKKIKGKWVITAEHGS